MKLEKGAITEFKKVIKLKTGDIIYCYLTHVSISGVGRSITFFAIKKNKPISLNYYIGKILKYKHDKKNGGLKIAGGGMDMGYSVIDDLSNLTGLKLDHQWI